MTGEVLGRQGEGSLRTVAPVGIRRVGGRWRELACDTKGETELPVRGRQGDAGRRVAPTHTLRGAQDSFAVRTAGTMASSSLMTDSTER